jgi:hypothetical protein
MKNRLLLYKKGHLALRRRVGHAAEKKKQRKKKRDLCSLLIQSCFFRLNGLIL